jgi:hypothetical protein
MWSTRLTEPIKLENGKVLNTLDDVRQYIAAIPIDLVRHEKWQDMSTLLIDVAMGEIELISVLCDLLKRAIETPPYGPVRLMLEPKAAYVKRRGIGRPRKRLLGDP